MCSEQYEHVFIMGIHMLIRLNSGDKFSDKMSQLVLNDILCVLNMYLAGFLLFLAMRCVRVQNKS